MDEETADELRDVAQKLERLADSEEQFSPQEAIEYLVENHPNITDLGNAALDYEYGYYVGYDVGGKPACSNIGTSRSDAEQFIEDEHGYEVSVEMIENNIDSDRDGDALLIVSVTPDEDRQD